VGSNDIQAQAAIALVALILSVGCALIIMYLLGGNVAGKTTIATGRRWMNWAVMLFATSTFFKVFKSIFGGTGSVPRALVEGILVTVVMAIIAFVIGSIVARFRNGAELLKPQAQVVSSMNQKIVIGVLAAAALVLALYQFRQPSDYASCILQELPGTENDEVAFAKANKCNEQFSIDQRVVVPTSTAESRDCLIEYATSTTIDSARIKYELNG